MARDRGIHADVLRPSNVFPKLTMPRPKHRTLPYRAVVRAPAERTAVRGLASGGEAIVISDLAALRTLTSRGLAPSLPAGRRVRLALVAASDAELHVWEKSLTRHAQACGCEAGVLGFALAGSVFASLHFTIGADLALIGLPALVTAGGLTVLAMLVAKVAYIHFARRSLRQLYREIAGRTPSEEALL